MSDPDRLAELKAAGETGADLSPGDPLCAWAAAEIQQLRTRLKTWADACTGRHGSQASCLSNIGG